MVPVHCPSPHSHLSINQVSFKSQQQFKSYFPDKVPDGRRDRQRDDYYASPFREHKNKNIVISQGLGKEFSKSYQTKVL